MARNTERMADSWSEYDPIPGSVEEPGDAITIAKRLHAWLMRDAAGTAQVEADLYRRPAEPYALSAAINEWQEWTPAAATQFVADCAAAASASLRNKWWQAFAAIERTDLVPYDRPCERCGDGRATETVRMAFDDVVYRDYEMCNSCADSAETLD